jgi:hypothetical protein
MRMLRALFMRIINWIRNVASTASRGLCNGEARRFAKPLDLLGRNAKTRWGEPAGLMGDGHVGGTNSMEAVSWTRNLALFWKMPGDLHNPCFYKDLRL